MQGLNRNSNDSSHLAKKKYPFHYAWVVAAVTFFTILVSAGIRSTPGVLIVPLEEYFSWDRTQITFAVAINLLLYGLFAPFAAALIERYGARRVMLISLGLLAAATGFSTGMKAPWQLILTWGLMVGAGTGCISSILGAAVVNKWFKERKGLVVGLLTASMAAGQLIFLPVLAKAVETNGWQLAVWITTASTVTITVLVFFLMRDKPSDVGLFPYGASAQIETGLADNPFKAAFDGLKKAVIVKEFWLLSGSFFVCGATTNGLIGTHFIPASVEKGLSEVTAASLLALMGVVNIIGTTASGWLTDRYDNRWLLFWYYALRGLSLVFLPHVLGSGYFSFGLFVLFYGLDWLATVPPTVRLTTEIFGSHGGIVYGWIFVFHQLGSALAAVAGGAMHGWLGSYTAAFIIAGVFCMVASGLVMNIRRAIGISVNTKGG